MNIFINEDNDHYFKFDSSLMTEKALREYIDQYVDFGVSTIVFCTSGQRTSYRSEVLDAIWDPLSDGSLPTASWALNAKKLFDNGIDPYHVWLDQCRKLNMQCWISTRMNDMHHTHPSLRYRGDRRWFEHPEWTREPERFNLPAEQSWQYYQDLQAPLAWSYSHPEVRALMLELLTENVRRYEADAFELDFSRDFYCMPPGFSVQDMEILTEFIRLYRQKVNKYNQLRKRNSQIAVRLPWTPELALAWGFDVTTWSAEGLIDIVIASPYWRSFQYDFSKEHWKTFVGDHVTVIPAIDFWISPGPELPLQKMTAEFLRGWCRNQEALGAEAVYLFNFPYWIQETDNDKTESLKIRELASRGLPSITRQAGTLRYQVGYQDLEYPGQKCDSVLPLELDDDVSAEISLLIKNPPQEGRVTVLFSLENQKAEVELKLNGYSPAADGTFSASNLRDGENIISIRAGKNRLLNLCVQCDIPESLKEFVH